MNERPWQVGSQSTGVGGDSGRTVARAWDVLRPTLRPLAQRITQDADEEDDLMQEALIELWLIDPSRFDLRAADDCHYLRRMLANRMWSVQRGEA